MKGKRMKPVGRAIGRTRSVARKLRSLRPKASITMGAYKKALSRKK